jgi:hypothetical protein
MENIELSAGKIRWLFHSIKKWAELPDCKKLLQKISPKDYGHHPHAHPFGQRVRILFYSAVSALCASNIPETVPQIVPHMCHD